MNRHENLVNRIVELVSERVPGEISDIGQDLKSNVSSLLKESFSKMDLVSREEFEVQTKVLARTRQKLESLQRQLDAVEERLFSEQASEPAKRASEETSS